MTRSFSSVLFSTSLQKSLLPFIRGKSASARTKLQRDAHFYPKEGRAILQCGGNPKINISGGKEKIYIFLYRFV
jgi:hypothetical protein